jgi:outer membrane protein assembly factor BamB
LEKAWTFKLPKRRNVGSRRPAIWKDRTYVVFFFDKEHFRAGELIAFADNGEELWRVEINHVPHAPIVAEDGTVFVGDMGGTIRAVSATGAVLWSTTIRPGNMEPPCLIAGYLVCADINNSREKRHTYGVCAEDGRVMWRIENSGRTRGFSAKSNVVVYSSKGGPADAGSWLQTIDVSSGQLVWRKQSRDLGGAFIVSDLIWAISARGVRFFDLTSGDDAGALDVSDRLTNWINIGERVFLYDRAGKVWLTGRGASDFEVLWSATSQDAGVDEPLGVLVDATTVGDEHVATLARTGQLNVWNIDGKRVIDGVGLLAEGQLGGLSSHGDRLFAALGRELVVAKVLNG